LKLIFDMLAYLKGIQDVGVAVVTRGKNDINTVRFLTQTASFVS